MTAVNFNYMSESSFSSLFRNGKVLTRRDVNGSDAGSEGIDLTSYEMKLTDARKCANTNPLSLHSNGFELLPRKSQEPMTDFFDSEHVVKYYYPECAEIIKECTGADQVLCLTIIFVLLVAKKQIQSCLVDSKYKARHMSYTATIL